MIDQRRPDDASPLVAEALRFFEPRRVWESIWRCHAVLIRSAKDSTAMDSSRASARSALDRLRKTWPAQDMEGYLKRTDVRRLFSLAQL
jgi:hypothetical protein